MHRRTLLAASAAGVGAALAGCTSTALQTDDPDSAVRGAPPENDPGNAIEVSGSGEVEAEPDLATLSVGVEARGGTADEVNDELRREAAALREAFDELGIPDERVESGRFDVRQRRRGSGFEGTHTFRIELRDPDRVGEVIDAAIAAGADDVGRVSFGLREETRDELRGDALDEALADADREAAHVAANRGVEITGTRSVRTNDVGVRPVYAMAAHDAAEEADAPPTEIEAGPVTVTASVTVTYSFADPE